MDARPDEIELAQDLVRIVERPVDENIGLDALEDAKATVEPCVEAIDLGVLLPDLLDAEAAGITGGLRVVGDAEIFIAALACRFRLLLERIASIRLVRVGVENSAQVLKFDQPGNEMLARKRDLAAALAQFRLDVLQTQRFINASFRLRGDALVAAAQASVSEAEALTLGKRAKLLQMGVRAPPQRLLIFRRRRPLAVRPLRRWPQRRANPTTACRD